MNGKQNVFNRITNIIVNKIDKIIFAGILFLILLLPFLQLLTSRNVRFYRELHSIQKDLLKDSNPASRESIKKIFQVFGFDYISSETYHFDFLFREGVLDLLVMVKNDCKEENLRTLAGFLNYVSYKEKEKRKAKGILIVKHPIEKEYKGNVIQFFKLIEFAQKHNICIVSTTELSEILKKYMSLPLDSKNTLLERTHQKIVNCKGIFKLSNIASNKENAKKAFELLGFNNISTKSYPFDFILDEKDVQILVSIEKNCKAINFYKFAELVHSISLSKEKRIKGVLLIQEPEGKTCKNEFGLSTQLNDYLKKYNICLISNRDLTRVLEKILVLHGSIRELYKKKVKKRIIGCSGFY